MTLLYIYSEEALCRLNYVWSSFGMVAPSIVMSTCSQGLGNDLRILKALCSRMMSPPQTSHFIYLRPCGVNHVLMNILYCKYLMAVAYDVIRNESSVNFSKGFRDDCSEYYVLSHIFVITSRPVSSFRNRFVR